MAAYVWIMLHNAARCIFIDLISKILVNPSNFPSAEAYTGSYEDPLPGERRQSPPVS